MKKSTLIILIIWVYIVGASFVQGFYLPSSELAVAFSSFPSVWPMVVIPPIVIIIGASLGPGPGKRWVGAWIDRRFGQGSCSKFLRKLKPELLFASMGFALGITGLIRAWQHNGPKGAFVTSSFFLSSGIGFVIAYFITRTRKIYEA